jgi:PTH1 family peptidyl-tRNA hydrolase
MKLIVGLGNPGKEYAKTRHNIGWMLLDLLKEKFEATEFRSQVAFQAEVSEARLGSEKVLLVKPTTYMNNSGETVNALISYYHLTPTDILVLQDEMDYPLGKFAFAASGGAAGHNGIGSIHTLLGTKAIGRLRLGIDRPQGPLKAQDYVLQAFSDEERGIVVPALETATKAVQDWITLGLTASMNSWNGVEHGVDRRTDRASRLSSDPEDRK